MCDSGDGDWGYTDEVARATGTERTMTLSRVEHALGMMRIDLVECAAQND